MVCVRTTISAKECHRCANKCEAPGFPAVMADQTTSTQDVVRVCVPIRFAADVAGKFFAVYGICIWRYPTGYCTSTIAWAVTRPNLAMPQVHLDYQGLATDLRVFRAVNLSSTARAGQLGSLRSWRRWLADNNRENQIGSCWLVFPKHHRD